MLLTIGAMNKGGNDSIGIPPHIEVLYAKLCMFLDSAVSCFPTEPEYSTANEDSITRDISLHLNDCSTMTSSEYQFVFVNQDKRSDIGVHIRYSYKTDKNLLCWIEAKRLPTPPEKDRDEREYVFVDHSMGYRGNGGIERFKLNKHGDGLPVAMMFGYVQSESFDHWNQKVNGWIRMCSQHILCHQNEILVNEGKNRGRFVSTHKRIDHRSGIEMQDITIHHFWIYL